METFAKVWAKLPNGAQIPLRPTSAQEFEELGYQRVHEVITTYSNFAYGLIQSNLCQRK
jgi:hypothetical protein